MPRVPPVALVDGDRPEGSAAVAVRIAAARSLQLQRAGRLNARLDGRRLRAACAASTTTERRLVELADVAGLSARGTSRVLRVARTIADLAGAAGVERQHLEEAARYRPAQAAQGRAASA